MKQAHLLFFPFAGAFFFGCQGNTGTPAQTPASTAVVRILDPEAAALLDSSATVETLAQGFTWSEGPLYISDGDYFLFSDIPQNKVFKWKEGADTSTYLNPSGNTGPLRKDTEQGSNGLLLDSKGNLVLCQDGDRRIARMDAPVSDPKPRFITLADRYQGKRFNSPNDAVYHPNGDLYFTDPPYGLPKGIDDPGKELDFQGVFRLKPNGQLDLFTKELKYPNGIAFSPDGKSLYVASSDPANYVWMQYELDSAGLLKSSRVFHEAHAYEGKDLGAPDGMKVNKKGYIFASGPEGIWVFNPGGKLIARIYPGEITSNCAFSTGEAYLYMTCNHKIMRIRLKH